MRDPYAVLGVARGADQDTIRKAFKDLAKKYHPDRNQDNAAAVDKFKSVNAAYDVLKDPEKRSLFDQFGEASLRPGFDAARARAWQRAGGGFGRSGGGGGFEDLFGSMFGGGGFGGGFGGGVPPGGARGFTARPGKNIEVEVSVDLGAVLRGEKVEVRYHRPVHHSDGSVSRAIERVKVRVPPAVEAGGTIRLRGKGGPGRNGGPDGDLLISVQYAPHPFLRREGIQLYMEVPLTIHEALAGARIEVPTPTGSVKVKVPAGTASGQKLRLKGRGIEGRDGVGDLYLVLRPTPPESDDAAALEAAETLNAFYGRSVREDLTI